MACAQCEICPRRVNRKNLTYIKKPTTMEKWAIGAPKRRFPRASDLGAPVLFLSDCSLKQTLLLLSNDNKFPPLPAAYRFYHRLLSIYYRDIYLREAAAIGQFLTASVVTAAATLASSISPEYISSEIPHLDSHPGHLPGLRPRQRSGNIGTSGLRPYKRSSKHGACECSRSHNGPGSRCFLLTNGRSCSQPSSSRHFFLLAPTIIAANRIHRNRVTITLFPLFLSLFC
ncbi:hypothetical protein GW17_00035671 [Ensete ventricosum]|nr:hypothetical protein GW17_00035671 [Ensete ventricosum]